MSKQELHNELLLNEAIRLTNYNDDEEASVSYWLQNRVRLAKCNLTKRQMKQYEKEGQVLFRHLHGKKPKVIAKELGVTPNFINNSLVALRNKGRQVLGLDQEEVKEKRATL